MNQKHIALYTWRLALVVLSCFVLLFLPSQVAALDLNVADSSQLQKLPGIGPKTAEMIVQERERGGAFTSLEDLSDRVRGIGPKRLESLQEAGLQVKSQSSASSSTNHRQ